MSLRPALLPFMRSCARPAPARGFHYLSRQPGTSARMPLSFQRAQPRVMSLARSMPRAASGNGVRAALAVGLGLTAFSLAPSAHLDAPAAAPAGLGDPNVIVVEHDERREPPQSIVSVPQLTFGATCGICAGVFVKKGFKILAFALGGVFVLLQYLSSKRFVSVDWKAVSKSYDGAIATVDEQGRVTYPTPQSILNGFIDFLTANFQQRATFMAGFILGLRLG